MELVHHHFDSLPSTNGWAKKQLSHFDQKNLMMITADAQSEGRGQYGRKWISPPFVNLYVTFCFFIEQEVEPYALTHLLALSTARLFPFLPCQIKWPNDLMVHDKKIAGILCETEPFQKKYGIVLGMGLNVNMELSDLQTIDQPATSLLNETGTQQEITVLRNRLALSFLDNLKLFNQQGLKPFESAIQMLFTQQK